MKKHCKNLPGKVAMARSRCTQNKTRGLQLLPYTIRENLPLLGSQQSMGGQAKVLTRWFTADGSLAWYITEGSARRDTDGKAVDYLLYGLVEGPCKKLDYFWLSDLETVRGPTGLPIERDLR